VSALTVIKSGGKVHIVTDGAGTIGNRLMILQPKVTALPHLDLAVAARELRVGRGDVGRIA